MKITCPHCGQEIEIDPELAASALGKKGGSVTSDAKKKSSADNLAKARAEGKKGGWPKGTPRKKKRTRNVKIATGREKFLSLKVTKEILIL